MILTGESNPVVKTCLNNTEKQFSKIDNSNNIVYSGTTIL